MKGILQDKKVELSDLQPKGFKTIDRPSEEEISKIFNKRPIEKNVDSYFLQEISDRLFGPDSQEYIKAIENLNKSFKGRPGRYGNQFYEPNL